MNVSAVLGETPFAVIDLETTGIYPGGNDRIIEVAVVRFSPNLEILEEWSTLVNPHRDIGRTDIHRIRAGDVAQAPTFEEIAADIGTRIQDAVVVGHQLRFDLGFLDAEYERCGVHMPELPGLCTLTLAYQFLPEAPSRKLGFCCEQVGIAHEEEHVALEDARATGYLLAVFLKEARRHGLTTLQALGCRAAVPGGPWLGSRVPSGKRVGRDAAAARRVVERSYLARLVAGMVADDARSAQEAEYLMLVDRALEDRRVTPEEATHLTSMAIAWGMTRDAVLNAHRAYLSSLVSEAMADGHVTEAERLDLIEVCDMLGLHRAVLDVLLLANAAPAPRVGPAAGAVAVTDLRGKSVCFTGELLSSLEGERLTRETAEKLATVGGLEVRPSVTKKLDLLVVADPETQSIKARKAREYGVRIMAEAAFWKALGVRVE